MKARYISIKKLSLYISMPVKTLYEWTYLGRIPSIKIGRRVLFDLEDIEQTMQSLKRSNEGEEKTESVCRKILG